MCESEIFKNTQIFKILRKEKGEMCESEGSANIQHPLRQRAFFFLKQVGIGALCGSRNHARGEIKVH